MSIKSKPYGQALCDLFLHLGFAIALTTGGVLSAADSPEAPLAAQPSPQQDASADHEAQRLRQILAQAERGSNLLGSLQQEVPDLDWSQMESSESIMRELMERALADADRLLEMRGAAIADYPMGALVESLSALLETRLRWGIEAAQSTGKSQLKRLLVRELWPLTIRSSMFSPV